jgi:hypothetical protein
MRHAIVKVTVDKTTHRFEATAETNSDCLDILSPEIAKFPEDATYVMVFKQWKGTQNAS